MDAGAIVRRARRSAQLSQRELGQRAGTSGPTIAAYEAGTKVPRVDTLERIVAAAGGRLDVVLEPAASDWDLASRRSLALHREVVSLVRRDPESVRRQGRANLARLRSAHPDGWSDRWFDEWEGLLDGPVEELIAALSDPTDAGVDRRQASPLATLLPAEVRWRVIRETREAERAP